MNYGPPRPVFVMFGFGDGFRMHGVHASYTGLHGGPVGTHD